MIRVLDWGKLRQNAKNAGVSVYTLAKRKLNYRKCSYRDGENNCCNCRASDIITFPEDNERIQCVWIGYMRNDTANIDNKHICNFYEKVADKNIITKGDLFYEAGNDSGI